MRASTAHSIDIVSEWHAALNAGDAERLVALVVDDVEVGGPRGAGRGAELMREWVERAEIRLAPERVYERDGTVVVEQRAAWRLPETGAYGEPQVVASTFRVSEGRIQAIHRHATLDEALSSAELDAADEVQRQYLSYKGNADARL